MTFPPPSEAVRTVLLDTNAFGGGALGSKELVSIRRLTEAGVKVVVPDVVCHELAIHVVEHFKNVNFSLLESAGIDVGNARSIYGNPDSLIAGIRGALTGVGCNVVDSDPSWWQEGVLGQIAVRPPAEKKGKVRTGAVDTIISLHATYLQEAYGSVLVLTEDAVLKKYLEANSIPTSPTFQDATGKVLQNASEQEVLDVLSMAWHDPSWISAFTTSVWPLMSGAVSMVRILGLSNLVSSGSSLHGTIAFTAQESTTDEGPDGGERFSTRGRYLYTVETSLDSESLLPLKSGLLQEQSMVYDYRNYPLPTRALDYVHLEQISLPNPQAAARFVVDTDTSLGSRADVVHAYLDDRHVADVTLVTLEIEKAFNDTTYLDHHGSVTFHLAEDLHVSWHDISGVGSLGALMTKLWVASRNGETASVGDHAMSS